MTDIVTNMQEIVASGNIKFNIFELLAPIVLGGLIFWLVYVFHQDENMSWEWGSALLILVAFGLVVYGLMGFLGTGHDYYLINEARHDVVKDFDVHDQLTIVDHKYVFVNNLKHDANAETPAAKYQHGVLTVVKNEEMCQLNKHKDVQVVNARQYLTHYINQTVRKVQQE